MTNLYNIASDYILANQAGFGLSVVLGLAALFVVVAFFNSRTGRGR